MIRQQSCRAGFRLCACVDLAHTGQAYSAAEEQRARQLGLSVDALIAPPLRVSQFTDDVISRIHLRLCLLDVRFIAQRWMPRYTGGVWYHSTLHSVFVWLIGSLGGKHTRVFEGFARSWLVS